MGHHVLEGNFVLLHDRLEIFHRTFDLIFCQWLLLGISLEFHTDAKLIAALPAIQDRFACVECHDARVSENVSGAVGVYHAMCADDILRQGEHIERFLYRGQRRMMQDDGFGIIGEVAAVVLGGV